MPDEALLAVKERAADVLMRIPGVTGVGIGGRERDGSPTGELVLKVFVQRKRPLAELTPGEALPTWFEGVGIDVSELGIGRLETAPPIEEATPATVPGSPLTSDHDTDDERYRPLIGGSRVQSDMSGVGFGTLGCFLLHATDPNKVYAITNYHVVVGGGQNRPPAVAGSTRVGQSEASSSPTKCCSHMIGTFVGGGRDTVRDAALIQLDAGMEYRKELMGIGVVTGTHTITQQEAQTQRYAVRKRGARTRLTGGVVEAINTTHTSSDGFTRSNITVVKPNPNVAVPAGRPLYFSDAGDSGSVLVNDQGQAVTLHFAGAFVAAQKVNKGLELPIEQIIATFVAEGFQIAMATATTTGVVFTVPGATTVALPEELVPALAGLPAGESVRVPLEASWLPGVPLPTPHLLAGLEQQLDSTRAGRLLISLWLRHGSELIALLESHRRVALVWHRCGGPALMQMFFRMTSDHTLAMPQTINGRPLSEAFCRIADAFAPHASPGLRHDLAAARTALPDLGGMTYPQVLTAFRLE
ncbi:hypothetical protein [Streptomyces sp. HUAS TT20]|uniref:hypothetical protein n=1 Tax=Streptomyces sp. HUAS TT20 TaxID=3447509 RepID=UPI0021D8EB10|nr:hypothetical protein [Streptomyces sp. HUAS 15-9]UXY32069.1 hypothetical protein N8I87_39645 [Streptomyces sp. HUAS 15-9]